MFVDSTHFPKCCGLRFVSGHFSYVDCFRVPFAVGDEGFEHWQLRNYEKIYLLQYKSKKRFKIRQSRQYSKQSRFEAGSELSNQ